MSAPEDDDSGTLAPMKSFARFVVCHRYLVLLVWIGLAVAGGVAAPRASRALTYDFSLPGQRGYEANQEIVERFASGGAEPPVLLVVGDGTTKVTDATASQLSKAVTGALQGARVVSYADQPALRSADGLTGVLIVHPVPLPGAEAFATALPALEKIAAASDTKVTVTGEDALAEDGGGGGAGVLAETIFGGVGALVVLVLVFGSGLALMPLLIAAASILTTFLIVWGLTAITDVSFIVQFLLALIGLGVAIDYALLMVTRWREERGAGADDHEAIERAMATAGRSVLFSGITVAVSLAALIVLPVPFLRSVGFTGLLIPLVSVIAALTLLPALLATIGRRLEWPRRRSADSNSRLWHRIGTVVVAHRWVSAVGATIVLLLLAFPVTQIRLGQASMSSLASSGGAAATAISRIDSSGIGIGVAHPVEIVTSEVSRVTSAVSGIDGVAGVVAPPAWTSDGLQIVDAWTTDDTSTSTGSTVAAQVRRAAEGTGAVVGGSPAEDADFLSAVYGNAPWVLALIVLVTFVLLAFALRSIWLPVKALLLNVLSLGAAYGVTVLIWQEGFGTELLFSQSSSGAVTIWVPTAVFAFLFGLSMDYEVFLLSRIREEYDESGSTDAATVAGVSRTGRLVSSGALILFLAFVSLSRVPAVEVKILATGLALGIVIDATLVRGVLAPALVALLGDANWWLPKFLQRNPPPTPS